MLFANSGNVMGRFVGIMLPSIGPYMVINVESLETYTQKVHVCHDTDFDGVVECVVVFFVNNHLFID